MRKNLITVGVAGALGLAACSSFIQASEPNPSDVTNPTEYARKLYYYDSAEMLGPMDLFNELTTSLDKDGYSDFNKTGCMKSNIPTLYQKFRWYCALKGGVINHQQTYDWCVSKENANPIFAFVLDINGHSELGVITDVMSWYSGTGALPASTASASSLVSKCNVKKGDYEALGYYGHDYNKLGRQSIYGYNLLFLSYRSDTNYNDPNWYRVARAAGFRKPTLAELNQ